MFEKQTFSGFISEIAVLMIVAGSGFGAFMQLLVHLEWLSQNAAMALIFLIGPFIAIKIGQIVTRRHFPRR